MDPNNYKIPKKRTINYGPKLKPSGSSRPPKNSQVAHNVAYQLDKPVEPIEVPVISKPKPYIAPQKTVVEPKSQTDSMDDLPPSTKENVDQHKSNQDNTKWLTGDTKPKRRFKKPKKLLFLMKTVLIIVFVICLLGAMGYIGYKAYKANQNEVSTSNSTQQPKTLNGTVKSSVSSKDPIINADFIVYGIKTGSLFKVNRADYAQDPNVSAIIATAKSTYPNDKRQITINQQKVASTFASDPEGLKKMADGIGPNTTVTGNNGTSYIVTGNSTGIIAIGSTLISIRSSVSLAMLEWQQLFNDLEPLKI